MTENSSRYNSKNRAAPPNVSTILKSHTNRELTKRKPSLKKIIRPNIFSVPTNTPVLAEA